MTERDRLLAAVCETPDDDAPRLVFSDWCEENGNDARAEFVRIQVALAKMDEGDDAWVPLTLRERELLDGNGEAWRADLPPGLEATRWRRGFVEEAVLREGDGAAAVDRVPITVLDLGQPPSPAVLGSPLMPRLARLRLDWADRRMDARALAALVGSPALAGLRGLRIDQGLAASHLRALADAWPASLERLDLTFVDDAGAATDALRWPERLADLALDLGCDEGSPAPVPVADWLPVGVLRRLRIRFDSCELGPTDLSALLERGILGEGLEALELEKAGLSSAEAIASSPRMRSLRVLDLTLNRLGPNGAEMLAESPYLPALERLDLGADLDDVGDHGTAALMRGPGMPRLRRLELNSNRIGPAGARAIAESGRAARLLHLHLYGNPLEAEGVLELSASPHLRRLRGLNLAGGSCPLEQLPGLLVSPLMPGLLDLEVYGYRPDDAALAALARSPLPSFANVSLGAADPSPARDAAKARFKDRLNCG